MTGKTLIHAQGATGKPLVLLAGHNGHRPLLRGNFPGRMEDGAVVGLGAERH